MADKNKNEKLIEKIDSVIEKLNSEKNPFKRAFYTVKLEMLNARIQKEIDIMEIKEKYEKEKEERLEEANNEIRGNTKEKFNRIKTRDFYRKEMENLSDFDPKSSDFAFRDELDMAGGDIEKLLDGLHNDGNNDIALKIEAAIEAREKYEEAKDDLHQMKSEGFKIQTKTNFENAKSTAKETALVVAKRTNIFKTFFNAIKKGFEEFNQTRKDNKAFKLESKRITAEIKQREDENISNLNASYKEQRAALEEELARIQEKMDDLETLHERQKEGVHQMHQNQYDKVGEAANASVEFRRQNRNKEATEKTNLIVQKFMDKQPIEDNEQQQSDGQEH